jgi:eukaryotic-like serine/threonine-protein kinase
VSAPDDLIAGRYRLVELVGSGGMGAVWQAWDERLHRTVALKQVPLAPGLTPAEADLANQRAMREARITARLSHPYAVSVFDVVEHEGRPCIVMQFLPSVTLSSVLQDGGPLEPGEAIQVGSQIASALAAAHQAGITHRDVKPGNILIADDGTALISDFGISHALGDATLTFTGLIHGTPAFIAPEVARGGEATFASDVFSLGSTLYAALEGEPPFGRDPNTIALLHKVASGVFPPPQRAGPLTFLLGQMLSPDPADRPSMKEVAGRLERLAAGGDDPEAPLPPPPPPPEQRRRWNGRVLASVAALVTAAVLATVLWWQYGEPGPLVARSGESAAPGSTPSAARTSATPTPSQAAGSGQPTVSRSTPADPTTRATTQSPTRTTAPRTSRPRTSRPRTTRQPTRAPARGADANSATDLVQAITSYYALMPTGTDRAWPRMTANYQTNHAGGRQAYERFWDKYRQVSVSRVIGRPPGRAEATIVYFYKNGRVDTERTAYGLVEEDGQLKIASSDVLSSVRRDP